jgi:hypothetical protein
VNTGPDVKERYSMHSLTATDLPGQTRPMPKPSRPDIPQTADTIARAKAECEAARDEARRTTGLEIGPDGFARLPQGSCLEAVETLIAMYGLRFFLGTVEASAAMRHVLVEWRETDRVASLLEGGK